MRPSVTVRLDEAGRGTITIDGKPLEGVRAVTVKSEVMKRTVVVLELYASAVDFQQQGPDHEGVPDAAAQQ